MSIAGAIIPFGNLTGDRRIEESVMQQRSLAWPEARLLCVFTLSVVGLSQSSPTASAQQPSGCRDARDVAAIAELQKGIASQRSTGDGQAGVREAQAELDALLSKPLCSPSMEASPGPGQPAAGAAGGQAGMQIGDCRIINCDCDNISSGLLTNSYIRQCRATEESLKKSCQDSGGLIKTKCHSIAAGPNPVLKWSRLVARGGRRVAQRGRKSPLAGRRSSP